MKLTNMFVNTVARALLGDQIYCDTKWCMGSSGGFHARTVTKFSQTPVIYRGTSEQVMWEQDVMRAQNVVKLLQLHPV